MAPINFGPCSWCRLVESSQNVGTKSVLHWLHHYQRTTTLSARTSAKNVLAGLDTMASITNSLSACSISESTVISESTLYQKVHVRVRFKMATCMYLRCGSSSVIWCFIVFCDHAANAVTIWSGGVTGDSGRGDGEIVAEGEGEAEEDGEGALVLLICNIVTHECQIPYCPLVIVRVRNIRSKYMCVHASTPHARFVLFIGFFFRVTFQV